MRNTLDPFGGSDTVVDKVIGNAYDVVLAVRMKLRELMFIVANMDSLMEIANNLKSTTVVSGISGVAGATTIIQLPLGMSPLKILSSTVMLADQFGNMYTPDSGYFTTLIQGGNLHVIMAPTAPIGAQNIPIRWFITSEA